MRAYFIMSPSYNKGDLCLKGTLPDLNYLLLNFVFKSVCKDGVEPPTMFAVHELL
jgi:hypothetical protein